MCKETGKVCFNTQQMDQHKRYVPEAQTFEEQTISDLKKAAAEKAAAGGGPADMETEEDMLLRQAGVKGKKKADAGPAVVTKETVEQLVEMGFTELRAQKALVKTSNAGLEQAVGWLTDHLEDVRRPSAACRACVRDMHAGLGLGVGQGRREAAGRCRASVGFDHRPPGVAVARSPGVWPSRARPCCTAGATGARAVSRGWLARACHRAAARGAGSLTTRGR